MTPLEQMQEKIAGLREALDQALPGMPGMLRTIHAMLKKDEDLVTMLSEDEIADIVEGLGKQVGVQITQTAEKKASRTAIKNITVDML